jgi:hypothetical protein
VRQPARAGDAENERARSWGVKERFLFDLREHAGNNGSDTQRPPHPWALGVAHAIELLLWADKLANIPDGMCP